jgi:hypothetical protein
MRSPPPGRGAAGRRQPSESNRKQHLQQQTEPERRKRDPGSGHRTDRSVEQPSAFHRGRDAGRNRQCQRRDNRDDDEFQRCGQALGNAHENGAAVAEAVAPVAAHERAEPRPVLLPQRPVQTEGAAKAFDVLRPDIGIRQIDRERSPGRRVHEREDDGRNDEQQRHRLNRAADQEANHTAPLI